MLPLTGPILPLRASKLPLTLKAIQMLGNDNLDDVIVNLGAIKTSTI